MLYNEERPYNFDQMKGQKHIVESIRNQAIQDKFMGVYIFHGQYGSGKTTMARIIALAANCPKDDRGNPDISGQMAKSILNGGCPDYMEVDGASKTGVDEIRKLIDDTAYQPSVLKRKIYIIDEVHMLSKASFNALLKTLEEPPAYAIFILCTTEFKSIPATVRSRSACYCFTKISNEDICEKLMEICKKRDIHASKDACMLIAKNSDGSLRNAESLLEQASLNGEYVSEETVSVMLGATDPTDVFTLIKGILAGNTSGAVQLAESLLASGKSMKMLLEDMLEIIADAIVLSYSNEKGLIAKNSHYISLLEELVGCKFSLTDAAEQFTRMYQEMRSDSSKTVFIINIVRICSKAHDENEKIAELQMQIDELKLMIENLAKEGVCISNNNESIVQNNVCDTEVELDMNIQDIPSESDDDVLPESEEVDDTDEADNIMQEETYEESEEQVNESACDTAANEKAASGAFDFSGFHMFQNIFKGTQSVSADAPIESVDAETKEECMENNQSEYVTEILEKVRKVASEDAAFFTAVYEGASMNTDSGKVIFSTPLEPIAELLKKYFEVYQITAEVNYKQDAVI